MDDILHQLLERMVRVETKVDFLIERENRQWTYGMRGSIAVGSAILTSLVALGIAIFI
jgi:hypothetical protein